MAIDKQIAEKILAVPAKLLKAMIVALSTFLTSLEPAKEAISMGKSKEDAGVNFLAAITGVMEDGNAADLPGDVIDFYNKYFVAEDDEPEKPKAEKKKKPAKKKTTVERDSFGFIKDSNHSKLATLLSKEPMKMGDVKDVMGNTYYSLMGKKEDVFAKDAANKWYVIGSPAEKLITSQADADAAQAKIDAEKKAKKDAAAEKKADAAQAKIDAEKKAKKDAAAEKKADAAAKAEKTETGKKKRKAKK